MFDNSFDIHRPRFQNFISFYWISGRAHYFHSLGQDQSTVTQRAETTVTERSLASEVYTAHKIQLHSGQHRLGFARKQTQLGQSSPLHSSKTRISCSCDTRSQTVIHSDLARCILMPASCQRAKHCRAISCRYYTVTTTGLFITGLICPFVS